MINEQYIKSSIDSFDESSQEEAFCQIFNPILEPMDINDEINHDKLYFVNNKDTNNNNIIYFEDFDEFYKKFFEIEQENDISNINIYEKPFFYPNLNLNNDKIFSTFENEKFFIVKNNKKEIKKDKNEIAYEKPKNINVKNKKNKNLDENYFFPFTPGKGLLNYFNMKKSEESFLNSESNASNNEKLIIDENSLNSEQINNNANNTYYEFKFKTKKYCIMPNGKKRRQKKKRKYKSDDIRKKIKSRFHKTLKNIVNNMLKKGGSKKFFDFLPQNFTGNVSKKVNSQSFEMTFNELLSYNFLNKKNKSADSKKSEKNKEVVEYLEQNPEISKNSGYDLIKNIKYKDLLKIYFSSAEFENSISRLKEEKEENDYIQEYIYRAKNYIEFYSNFDKDKISEDNDEE